MNKQEKPKDDFEIFNYANCKHDHGWYETIRVGIFRRHIFCCIDCRHAIDGKFNLWLHEKMGKCLALR